MTLTPASANLQENGTQQFTSSEPATWTTSCGTISSSGLYKAPLYPTTSCKVTATAISGQDAGTAAITVVSPIVMTPVSAPVPLGQTMQFAASVPVTWTTACGTITPGGLYTASGATVGTHCTIEGIASSGVKYTVYGYATITAAPSTPPPAPLTIAPASATLSEGATQQFGANAGASFAASCGSINASGLYTAPLAPSVCTVTATPTTGTGSAATATVTVVSPITITPASVTTAQTRTQQFSANMPVAWSATCGSITPGGLFTASGTAGATCQIEAVATGSTPYTGFASDTIGAPAATFTITPASASVVEAATQQFTASGNATWISTCGTVSTAGLYKAPVYATTSCSVKATATDGSGNTASAAIIVTSPIVMTPVTAVVPLGNTQQFTANMPVTWTTACGTITSGGLYTASGATVGTHCTVEAIATGGVKYTAYGYTTIAAAQIAAPVITPASAATNQGQTQQFTANMPVTWSASCGTITASGLFTASAAPGSVCAVTAAAVSNPAFTSTAADTIGAPAPFTIAPMQTSVALNGTLPFTSTVAATWTADCGAIDPNLGVYTAPLTPGTCNITATAQDGTGRTAATTVNVLQMNYLTFAGNNARTNAQTQEFTLTPSNVNTSHFGKAWSLALDGGIWSQPLYVNALNVNGATHNVVFATTANDSVYAIDGDNGSLLWHAALLLPGATAVSGSSVGSSMSPIGIVGTPVIDADANTMYVVTFTAEQNNTVFVHRLHALNITTGAEMPNSPVVIAAPGFTDTQQMQRSALLHANGHIYVAFAGFADRPPYQGFIFAYQTSTLTLDAVFNDDPKSTSEGGGGIWMSAMGPAADGDGNIFVVTGNGFADGLTYFGQSAIKLNPSLQVLDYFTPYDHDPESLQDIDLGSGGALLIPDQTGTFQHEMVVCGKLSSIFVLNRDSMGGIGSTSDSIIQRVDGQIGQTGNFRDSGHPCFSTPAYWNQQVYIIANHDVMKTFTLDPNTGLLSSTPASQGTFVYSWPGAYASISSNGDTDPIIWAYDSATGTLRATDGTNVANELYVGTVYTSSKWSVPTVVNGHVYVEAQNTIFAFANH